MRASPTTAIRSSLAALLFLPATSVAQVAEASVSASGGTATDQRGVRSSAATLAPALTLTAGDRGTLMLGASLTRFQSGSLAFGGNAGASIGTPIAGPLSLGASASASTVATSYGATFVSAEAVPALQARLGPLTVYGGVRLAAGRSSVAQQAAAPGGPLGQRGVSPAPVVTSRSSVGPAAGVLLELAGRRPGETAAIGFHQEHTRTTASTIVDRSGTLALSSGALALSATAGWRDAADERVGFASGSIAMAVRSRVALQAAGGSYPSNRLSGALGGSFLSLGVVLRGARREPDATPAISGVPAAPSGMTRLSLREPSARRVELAGDWNDWIPVAATRAADGTWYADVPLGRGEYRYAFRVDGGRWVVPEHVAAVDDGFGGRSAVISVR